MQFGTRMKPRLWDYVRAAFNARPIGMFVPPNWLMLAAFALLGVGTQQPGLLVVGAGVELAYLSLLATNPRFQRFVAGSQQVSSQRNVQAQLQTLFASLSDGDRRRYQRLATRGQAILEQQFGRSTDAPGYDMQSESLGKLTWMYLRLLVTRQAILRVVSTGTGPATVVKMSDYPQTPTGERTEDLQRRLVELQRRLTDATLSDDLRHSLQGQADLLQQRLKRRGEAERKLAYLDAELQRIEEQIELIREQAVLSTDPETFSHRIDEIGASLTGTADWIAEQQRALGAMDDLLSESPSLTSQTRAKVSQ
jgi:hypothetical protein